MGWWGGSCRVNRISGKSKLQRLDQNFALKKGNVFSVLKTRAECRKRDKNRQLLGENKTVSSLTCNIG